MKLSGLTPEGELRFFLPQEKPMISLDIGLGEKELEAVLQTVCIRLDEMQVDLIWRGTQPYPGFDWLPEMKRMEVAVS